MATSTHLPVWALGLGTAMALIAACTAKSPGPTPSPTSAPTTSAPESSLPGSPSPEPTAGSDPAGSGAAGALDPASARNVTANLEAPWSIAFVGQTALVSLRDSGEILDITGDGTRVVGAVPDIKHGGEGGLLGIVIGPDSQLFAYSTGAQGNRIERFDLTGNPGAYGLDAPVTLVDQIPSAGNHNGGRLALGPDGMLYASTGDAGDSAHSQDLGSLGGKILRLNLDGSVPADNPFPGSYVYSLGHRNVQGLAWATDGTMFATKFGQSTWDELNIITLGSNYGWPIVEGMDQGEHAGEFVSPVQQWATSDASPSGMARVGDTLFIANLRGAVLRAVPVGDPGTATEYFKGELGRLRDVALSPTGDLWLLTNNTDGRGNPGPEDDRIVAVALTDS